MQLELTNEELSLVSLHLSCRLDDYKKEIRQIENASGKRNVYARRQHAKLMTLLLTKINPKALVGTLQLMDGGVLHPQEKQD